MKNKSKLAFEMLEMEMEVISSIQMYEFVGGIGTITYGPGGHVTDSLALFFGNDFFGIL